MKPFGFGRPATVCWLQPQTGDLVNNCVVVGGEPQLLDRQDPPAWHRGPRQHFDKNRNESRERFPS